MPDVQPRIIAYVSDGRLLHAAFEKDKERQSYIRGKLDYEEYTVFLVRKAPPYVADWLLSHGTGAQFFPNGEKAWDFVLNAGMVIREI